MRLWRAQRPSFMSSSSRVRSSHRRDLLEARPQLGEALDPVRKSEYARLSGKQRRFIKSQKCTLLSRKENLTLEGRQAL
jgi:hypothetical protein